ncbi:MAG: kynureninase [Candidatus Obscuribacter phosphatis]|uniref:Kynureninase n=1 Tax=Candidatus Obscuribacter phosphatis TaxID=1906157 RepID=A0A8J7PG42_9BACT|nr:kynureninase [Candidatus Obscuribacter phosphatis]
MSASCQTVTYKSDLDFARSMDAQDELAGFRDEFIFPRKLTGQNGESCVYLAGNSLGLQPKKARDYIIEELDDWGDYGVEGHFHARHPWMPYHEFVTEASARLVGALPSEVVVMNTLTVNLHLMMVSFYRPQGKRVKIAIEKGAFPSDQYACQSQLRFHGYDAAQHLIEFSPRPGEDTLRTEDMLAVIDKHKDELALVVLGDVNYLTGQAFDVPALAARCREHGVLFGLNLAHGAGNLLLQLNKWQVDFAVWCSYKYLNAGPGGLAGCFVHQKHGQAFDLPRFAGWWGHNKANRFKMPDQFEPMVGAEGWQLSNPPIFQLAALRASLDIFDRATMPKLRVKGDLLTGYLEYLLNEIKDSVESKRPGYLSIITPSAPGERGCQLSLRFQGGRGILERFKEAGVVCDFREPDVIRATPAPLYTSFEDVYRFAQVVKQFAEV